VSQYLIEGIEVKDSGWIDDLISSCSQFISK